MTIEMSAMQVLAPAKINLSLKILGRRNDGFHEIETLISPISLADKIDIERQSRWIDFMCDDRSVPPGDENLVVRAAKLFFEKTKVTAGVGIKLQKQIPHGAGLGGGSSDAASTLIALNQLFETKLSREEMAKLGSTIGSDIAFFLFESPAVCKGRGEIVDFALEAGVFRFECVGLLALAGFERDSANFMSAAEFRRSKFCERSRASRL